VAGLSAEMAGNRWAFLPGMALFGAVRACRFLVTVDNAAVTTVDFQCIQDRFG